MTKVNPQRFRETNRTREYDRTVAAIFVTSIIEFLGFGSIWAVECTGPSPRRDVNVSTTIDHASARFDVKLCDRYHRLSEDERSQALLRAAARIFDHPAVMATEVAGWNTHETTERLLSIVVNAQAEQNAARLAAALADHPRVLKFWQEAKTTASRELRGRR